jgi:hypothetical protein
MRFHLSLTLSNILHLSRSSRFFHSNVTAAAVASFIVVFHLRDAIELLNKMAPNIRTLSSLGGHTESAGHGAIPSVRPSASAASYSDYASSQGASSASTMHKFPFKFCCIPKLPNASQAESLLLRVVREFQPIIARRGYNVASISEMCCCNDGLDFEPTANAGSCPPIFGATIRPPFEGEAESLIPYTFDCDTRRITCD